MFQVKRREVNWMDKVFGTALQMTFLSFFIVPVTPVLLVF